MTAQLLYCTAPDEETATKVGEMLVIDGHAACVNVLPGMRSVFRWEGKIETADEVVFIVKTTVAAAPDARQAILDAHPYDCPCVIALPVDAANSSPAFLEWIEMATKA